MMMNRKPDQNQSASYIGAPPGFDPQNCRSLYVGNLHPGISDALLFEIFATFGEIEGCKLIKDKTTGISSGYGFVDYKEHLVASMALQALNGRSVYGNELKVNWAFAGGHREDTSNHYHIFVGDLSPDIDDKALFNAFSAFGTISDARVMWDQNTSRSRGYGFVAFRNKTDAERALNEMNGEWLGSRAIRCNWANQKSTPTLSDNPSMDYMGVVNQTSPTNSTVYVGNVAADVTDHILRATFTEAGVVEEVRIQREKGFAFVRMQSHDQAARGIVTLAGRNLCGKAIKCSWGKERSATAAPGPIGMVPVVPVAVPMPVMAPLDPYSMPPYSLPYSMPLQVNVPSNGAAGSAAAGPSFLGASGTSSYPSSVSPSYGMYGYPSAPASTSSTSPVAASTLSSHPHHPMYAMPPGGSYYGAPPPSSGVGPMRGPTLPNSWPASQPRY